MSFDADMPAFYFDLHKIFDKLGVPSKKFDTIINALEQEGYRVSRTHFNKDAIKTDADASAVFEIVKS